MGQQQAGAGVRLPAEVYDEQFVPALFQQWGPIVAAAATVGLGDRVLDVACGTGVLACAASERVGPTGHIVGLDPSGEMLAVARRKRAAVSWQEGRAEALPFPDASFDAVVSQFGLMFFADPVGGLREMWRVLRPGGRLAVAVCAALARSPGYALLADLLEHHFGPGVADAFRAPFSLGDPEQLRALGAAAGLHQLRVEQHEGTVQFGSIAALVSAERACVWTLGGLLDDVQFAQLLAAAEERLRPFQAADGAVTFGMPALIITATQS
ncbi:MAG: methyltransferase domain-containing protein [Chloroflexales bacterium]|nr:methyltransferase domain-containing protein [Chloroflexales bacterium]